MNIVFYKLSLDKQLLSFTWDKQSMISYDYLESANIHSKESPKEQGVPYDYQTMDHYYL